MFQETNQFPALSPWPTPHTWALAWAVGWAFSDVGRGAGAEAGICTEIIHNVGSPSEEDGGRHYEGQAGIVLLLWGKRFWVFGLCCFFVESAAMVLSALSTQDLQMRADPLVQSKDMAFVFWTRMASFPWDEDDLGRRWRQRSRQC